MRDAAQPYDVHNRQLDLCVGLLLDHGEAAGDGTAGQVAQRGAVEGDDSGGRREQPGQQPQQRGLAGAVGTEDADGGAGFGREDDPVEDETPVGTTADPVGPDPGPHRRLRLTGVCLGHRTLRVR